MAVMPVGLDRRSLACAERAGCEGDTLHCRNQLYGKEFNMFESTTSNQKRFWIVHICHFCDILNFEYFKWLYANIVYDFIRVQCSFQTFSKLTRAPFTFLNVRVWRVWGSPSCGLEMILVKSVWEVKVTETICPQICMGYLFILKLILLDFQYKVIFWKSFSCFRKCVFSRVKYYCWEKLNETNKRLIKPCCTVYCPFHLFSTLPWDKTVRHRVYKHLWLFQFQSKIHSWIHKDNALSGFHPVCSAVRHYPQYLRKSYLLQHGLELLHTWQTASVLDSNTPLANCLLSFFLFLLFQFC